DAQPPRALIVQLPPKPPPPVLGPPRFPDALGVVEVIVPGPYGKASRARIGLPAAPKGRLITSRPRNGPELDRLQTVWASVRFARRTATIVQAVRAIRCTVIAVETHELWV